MGHFARRAIVTDGLVFQADAANGLGDNVTNVKNIVTPTETGSFENGASVVDNAYTFDGTDDHIVFDYVDSIHDLSSTDFTLEAWFVATDFDESRAIISKDTFGVNFDWCIQIASATSISIYTAGTAQSVVATVPTMVGGVPYLVDITSDGGDINIMLNGVIYQTTTMAITNASQIQLTIGCFSYNNPNGVFLGKIPIVRIYHSALSEIEALQNYEATKHRFI